MKVVKEALKNVEKSIERLKGNSVLEPFALGVFDVLKHIVETVYGNEITEENSKTKDEETEELQGLSDDNSFLLDEFFYLREWTGQRQFRIIYDTDQHPFSQQFIQYSVMGRRNVVMLFETTTNALFGCYLEAPIYVSEYGFAEDFDTFVFALRSPILSKPTKFTKLRSFGDLCHFSISFKPSDECIIDIDGAFSIYFPLNDVVSEVNSKFKVNFKNATNTIFLGEGTDFALKRMLILDSY